MSGGCYHVLREQARLTKPVCFTLYSCLFHTMLTICHSSNPRPSPLPIVLRSLPFFALAHAPTHTQIVALRTRFKESGPGANGVQLEQGLTLMLSSREELNKFAATRDELGTLRSIFKSRINVELSSTFQKY
jgi:hypothetical protein